MNDTSNSEKTQELAADLFFVDESDLSAAKHGFGGAELSLSAPMERPGWHIGRLDDETGRNVASDYTLWLGDFPGAGMESYLASNAFKGMGPQTARQLMDAVEPDELASLLTGNGANHTDTDLGIPEKTLAALVAAWKAKAKEHAWAVLFHEMGLTAQQQRTVQDEMGAGIIPLLRKGPYNLLGRVPRYDFGQATALYGRLGVKVSDEDKIVAATGYWLEKTERDVGHTCAPLGRVVEEVSLLTGIDRDGVVDCIDSNGALFAVGERRGDDVLATRWAARRDAALVGELKRIAETWRQTGGITFSADSLQTTLDLSDEQVGAINLAVNNPVSIVTGGPGAGKTTMVQGLANALQSLELDIRICAPTGRAAKRIAETPGLADFDPSTIHMYLARHAYKDATQDVMIVDECSMIDVGLMLELLRSIPDGCSVVFIGDPDQLRPVGPGQPFKDMIEADRIPVAVLTGNFRQDSFSDTVKAARDVIHGNVPKLDGSLESSDFTFIEKPGQEQSDTILELYFKTLPSMLGNEFADNQILAPQRTRHVGITRLNALVQQRLFAGKEPVLTKKDGDADVHIHVGDKVLNRENNYQLGVMNGDVGTVLRERPGKLTVGFDMPGTIAPEAVFSGRERYNLEPAYAITVHKSQGSEYPGVIIPVTKAHGYMLSRSLLYTAITRGKSKVCLVGERDAFERAIRRFNKDFRYTLLCDALKSAL